MTERDAGEDLYDPCSGGRASRPERLRRDHTPSEPARTKYFFGCLIESSRIGWMAFVPPARLPYGLGVITMQVVGVFRWRIS